MQTVIFCLSPVLVFMGVVAEPLFRFLFTEKWLPAVPYFQVLCITGILFPIHSYNLSILKIKGRSDLFLRLEILKKVIIAISIIISVRFGIMGLIWSQVVTNFIAFFINSYYTGKYINYPALSQLKDIMPAIILSFAVGMGIYALDYFALVTTADIVRITLGPALGLALYLAFSWLLKFDSYNDIKNILLRR